MPRMLVEVPVAPCIENESLVYERISEFWLVADLCAPVSTTAPDGGL